MPERPSRARCGGWAFAVALAGACALAAGPVVAQAPSAAQAAANQAGQFAMDARHTGRSSVRGPRRAPAIVWRVRARRRIFASPTLTPEATIVFAGVDGMVHAVDRGGVERWAFAASGGVFATPATIGDRTIIGHGGGAFVALDRRGDVLWRLETDEDADASPTVAPDGAVLLAWRGVAAVDARSGAPRWRTRGARVLGGAAVALDGAVVYADVEGALVWLRAADGVELRRARVGSVVEGAPTIDDDGGVIVGSEDGHVRKFTAQGVLAWDVALGGPVRATPALGRDGSVIVGSEDLGVHSLDAATGARRWTVRTGGFVHSSARVDRDGWVYVGNQDDRLYAIEPSGRVAWTVTLGADIDASALLVSDGVLAVGCDDGGLYLLAEPSSGR